MSLCEYGRFCSFAHSEMEIGIELIHNFEFDEDFWVFWYKTVWCPFNLSFHDKVREKVGGKKGLKRNKKLEKGERERRIIYFFV